MIMGRDTHGPARPHKVEERERNGRAGNRPATKCHLVSEWTETLDTIDVAHERRRSLPRQRWAVFANWMSQKMAPRIEAQADPRLWEPVAGRAERRRGDEGSSSLGEE